MNRRVRLSFLGVLAGLVLFGGAAKNVQAENVYQYTSIAMQGDVSSRYEASRSYSSETPKVVSFWDSNDVYHVAYLYGDEVNYSNKPEKLVIQRYNEAMEQTAAVEITPEFPMFGNITTDGNYYYIVWGRENDSETGENQEVLCLAKYDLAGNKIACLHIDGYSTWTNYWGTKLPFRAGSCSLAIQGRVLACHYARQMFSGHQSDYVVYLNMDTMERIRWAAPYVSHSFDQEIIALSNGGFLTADHGDAFTRAFVVSKIGADGQEEASFSTFHFREGGERSYGYNETYAQLGGLAETSAGYILCGSSERTLSLAPAPTKGVYCGHTEARDLFVQVLKKDYEKYSGADIFAVAGESRTATGERVNNPLYSYYLDEGTTDYGVIWLTDYEDSYYAANPAIVNIDSDHIVILWEKLKYNTQTGEAYYMVLDGSGNVLREPVGLPGIYLCGLDSITCHDGLIYWTTSDINGKRINCLNPLKNLTDKEAAIEQYSVALDGSINLNVYIRISQDLLYSGDAKIIVDDEKGRTEYLPSDCENTENPDVCVLRLLVTSPHMVDNVTVTVKDSEKNYCSQVLSVKAYGDYLMAHAGEKAEYAEALPVVKAMLNYGGYAQQYFGVSTGNLANAGLYTAGTDPVATEPPTARYNKEIQDYAEDIEELEFEGASLVCDSKLSLKLYYKIIGNRDQIASNLDGRDISSYYYLDSDWLYGSAKASVLGDYLVVTKEDVSYGTLYGYLYAYIYSDPSDTAHSDIQFVRYSPLRYAQDVWKNGESDPKLAALCKALYYFDKAAGDYRKAH